MQTGNCIGKERIEAGISILLLRVLLAKKAINQPTFEKTVKFYTHQLKEAA